MEWVSVSSSTLSAIAYDGSRSTLFVQFHHGGTYAYSGVPQGVYEGLLAASSKGQYLDQNVKKAGFAYRRVG